MGMVTEKMLGSRYTKARHDGGEVGAPRDQDLHEVGDLVQQQDEGEEQQAQAGGGPDLAGHVAVEDRRPEPAETAFTGQILAALAIRLR